MEEVQELPSVLSTVLGDYRESGPLRCHEKLEVLDMVAIAFQCPAIIDAWIESGTIMLNQGIFMGQKRGSIDDLDPDIRAVLQVYSLVYMKRKQMINVLRCEANLNGSSEVSLETIEFWDAVRARMYKHYIDATANILKTGNSVLAVSLNHGDHMEGLLISIDEMEDITFKMVRLPFNLTLPRILRVRNIGLSSGRGIVNGDRAEEHFCLEVTFPEDGTSSRRGISYIDIKAVLEEKLRIIFELN